ncbi:MAG: hypothetical protein NC302_02070 [Bacteroidales bacterium]|nr:hypothetical protein [Bacteroidales bacterium]MCM1415786.1 hypothetical protein [bacterium]MCM1422720.1 hypothetical protein [bacterium]
MGFIIEYVNTISVFLSAVSAVMMVVVAFESKKVAKDNAELQKKMLALQEKYNKASLCPKCDIVCSEAHRIIKISLYNYGQGTMKISHLDILNKETNSLFHNMYEIVPADIGLSYYSLETKGRNIEVGGHIKLIEIDQEKLNEEGYEKAKKILAQYTITVYYTGAYEDSVEMSTAKDLAKLFGTIHRESCENV